MKKNEMGEASCTYGGNESRNTGCEYLRERDHLEDLYVDRRIILKYILKN